MQYKYHCLQRGEQEHQQSTSNELYLDPHHSKQSSIPVMHFSTVLLAASAGLISVASAGQVNFYSDTNCQNYIGESHPGSFQTTGYAFCSSLFLSPLCQRNVLVDNLSRIVYKYILTPSPAVQPAPSPRSGSPETSKRAAPPAAR